MWAGWVHHSWKFGHVEALCEVGPKMPECGSKTSMVPVIWANFGMFSARSKWFPVAIGDHDKTWLYHYDPETKQQSVEWRHSSSPRPKKFQVQKSAGKVLALIFWDKDCILLIDYLPKDQTINTECYSSLLVQLKDVLKKKCRRKVTKGSCSCTTMPQLTGHLQPRRNWPTWASSVLITLSILPLTTCSLDWKKKLKVRHFSSDTEVIAAAETRWDRKPSGFFNLLNFFWVACER